MLQDSRRQKLKLWLRFRVLGLQGISLKEISKIVADHMGQVRSASGVMKIADVSSPVLVCLSFKSIRTYICMSSQSAGRPFQNIKTNSRVRTTACVRTCKEHCIIVVLPWEPKDRVERSRQDLYGAEDWDWEACIIDDVEVRFLRPRHKFGMSPWNMS